MKFYVFNSSSDKVSVNYGLSLGLLNTQHKPSVKNQSTGPVSDWSTGVDFEFFRGKSWQVSSLHRIPSNHPRNSSRTNSDAFTHHDDSRQKNESQNCAKSDQPVARFDLLVLLETWLSKIKFFGGLNSSSDRNFFDIFLILARLYL